VGEEFTALIITGPNTGGKTVTLKTVGLLTLMAESGLHIPAESGSKIALFRQIFADIGDEQSIQQNLSTFSSHMTQIVNVLGNADGDSLVLLDEIGAGTDPAEGSALAKAVLLELVRRGTRVLATTHYGELKVFAYSQPGVENASVLFDPVTLEPTYEVRIGTPGSSNAFAIASRLGLAPRLLKEAAEMMGESQVKLYEVIERAEQDQRDLTEERRQAARARMDLENTKGEYEKILADLRAQRRELLREAREEARRIIARAKQRTEDLLNLLRQSVQEAREAKEAIAREAQLVAQYAPPDLSALRVAEPSEVVQAAREELAGISAEAAEATAEVAEPEPPAAEAEPPPVGKLSPGDAVLVRSVNERGTVLSPPDDQGEAEVQVGILRLRVPVADLAAAPEPLVTITRAPAEARVYEGPVPKELHLRGLRVDAAVYELDRYLDRAALVHHARVRIVHGKGTGAVRQAVHERLKDHPLVRSFHLADPTEGDSGVTVVELGEPTQSTA
jgi:DNA mismatch repair protein MutS2